MPAELLHALSRLAARRFGSFAEAAMSVLDPLEAVAPRRRSCHRGRRGERRVRVIDARGGDAARGLSIPLGARSLPTVGGGRAVDGEALDVLGPGPWAAAPLDAADGQIVGLLLASGSAGEAPPRELAQLLLLAARSCPTSGRASPPVPSCAGSRSLRATQPYGCGDRAAAVRPCSS